MAAPKFKSSELKKLFPEGKNHSIQDKQLIEALIKRLNQKLQDPQLAKKAALIIEEWINKKK